MKDHSRASRAVLALIVASLGVLIGAPSAVADTGRVVLDPAGPLFSADRLAPGQPVSAALGITNDSDESTSVHLRATQVRDDDNGCNDAERAVDRTCGPGAGELAEQLRLTVRSSAGASPRVSWTGSIHDLTRGVQLADGLPAGERLPLDLTVLLPQEAGNETQSDSVSFTLRVTLTGRSGPRSAAVTGVKHERGLSGEDVPGTHDGVRVLGIKLAATGAPPVVLLGLGIAAVAGGGLRVLSNRRRRSARRER